MKKITLLCLLLLLYFTARSQEKIENKFGKGFYHVVAADSSFSMKLGVRFQTLYMGELGIDESEGIQPGASNFLIRRSRLKFDGFAVSPKLEYKIELGLSNKDIGSVTEENGGAARIILDAVLKWNFYKNFSLWVGQTKLPGNRERVVSSANMQFVDRSQLNSKYNIDRDMGVQLRHHFTLGNNFLLREIFSFSQGDGRNITVGNLGGYDYTGRIELLPFGAFTDGGDYIGGDIVREQTPKFSIGITYDYNNKSVRTNGNTKDFMENDDGYFETNINTLFADLMFKYNGLSIMAEYANKLADDPIAKNSDGTETGDKVYAGQGFNLQAGYLMKNNWEIAARYTFINPDSQIDEAPFFQYTFGVSKYIVGHKLKVQSDLSYTQEQDNPDSALLYRIQFDIHF